jgi:hypothetical protein
MIRVFECNSVDSNVNFHQPSATSPLFFDNLHFEHFDKSVNHESRLTLLSKCSKWRLSKNRGIVADGWFSWHDDAFSDPNHCLLRTSMFLSTVFMPISTEGWKCAFLDRHSALHTTDGMLRTQSSCYLHLVRSTDTSSRYHPWDVD